MFFWNLHINSENREYILFNLQFSKYFMSSISYFIQMVAVLWCRMCVYMCDFLHVKSDSFSSKSLHFFNEFFQNIAHINHQKDVKYKLNIFHPVPET